MGHRACVAQLFGNIMRFVQFNLANLLFQYWLYITVSILGTDFFVKAWLHIPMLLQRNLLIQVDIDLMDVLSIQPILGIDSRLS